MVDAEGRTRHPLPRTALEHDTIQRQMLGSGTTCSKLSGHKPPRQKSVSGHRSSRISLQRMWAGLASSEECLAGWQVMNLAGMMGSKNRIWDMFPRGGEMRDWHMRRKVLGYMTWMMSIMLSI